MEILMNADPHLDQYGQRSRSKRITKKQADYDRDHMALYSILQMFHMNMEDAETAADRRTMVKWLGRQLRGNRHYSAPRLHDYVYLKMEYVGDANVEEA